MSVRRHVVFHGPLTASGRRLIAFRTGNKDPLGHVTTTPHGDGIHATVDFNHPRNCADIVADIERGYPWYVKPMVANVRGTFTLVGVEITGCEEPGALELTANPPAASRPFPPRPAVNLAPIPTALFTPKR